MLPEIRGTAEEVEHWSPEHAADMDRYYAWGAANQCWRYDAEK